MYQGRLELPTPPLKVDNRYQRTFDGRMVVSIKRALPIELLAPIGINRFNFLYVPSSALK